MTKIRTRLLAAIVAATMLSLSCFGGGDSRSDQYDETDVIGVVQGWPLLHPDDYTCGTATIQARTVLAVVARSEHLDFDLGCGPDDNGTAARRAVRLALGDTSWSAVAEGDGRWSVSVSPGTGRRYDWIFLEAGPQLLASGGDALLWSLFNWSSIAQP